MSSDSLDRAGRRAAREAAEWVEIAGRITSVPSHREITELALTGFDPASDLARRTRRWSYVLPDHAAHSLAIYAAALARAEAEAWERDDPIVATQALSDRRFLLGDRFVHWVVPWLLPISSTDEVARQVVDAVLDVGDHHRPAPALVSGEGMFPPGNDSIGPLGHDVDPSSLLGGWVFPGEPPSDLASAYRSAERRWHELAARHPGTAQLWVDLAKRAGRSAEHREAPRFTGSPSLG